MTQAYDDTIKAQVIADFAMGASKSALAKKYNVSRTTVIGWVQKSEPPIPTVSDAYQRERLGELVYEYLVTGFEALIAQNRLAADRSYLESNSASVVSLYDSIHAGVVAVAQAVDRGSERIDADGSPDAGGDREGQTQPG